jgi:hypothetical protein
LGISRRAVSPPGDISVGPYQGEIAAIEVARIAIGHIHDLKRHVPGSGRIHNY